MIDNDLEPLVAGYAKAHLSPTDPERSVISTRYDQLQRFLNGRTFQSGSYARFTSTTPVNDLDVIYVLPDEMLKQVLPLKGRRGVLGGVAGSYPIWGRYQPMRFISWGCKFLADALMLEERLTRVFEASECA